MNSKKTESGQVLFLLVIGIVSLIGFTALAIDGGRLYSERRNAQGVSDTSAFTGALYIGRSSGIIDGTVIADARLAALERAKDNGYDNADPDVIVEVTVVPDGYYYLVTVKITSEIDPTFVQLVYSGPLKVEAKSVARVLPLDDLGFGQALFSLNDSACKAMKFSGSSDIDINGSGILSNSDCCPSAISFEGDSNTDIEDDVSAAGCVYTGGSAAYSASSTNTGVPPVPPFNMPVPDCTGMNWGTSIYNGGTDTITFFPGKYDGLSFNKPARTYNFEPGLYCIVDIPGFTIRNGNVNGDRVMFYVTIGRFKITGGVVDLRAAHDSSITDMSGEVWNGMLVYMDPGNPNDVVINGNSGSYFQGTIYAPSAECQLNGNGITESIDLSLICDTIDIQGDAGLLINFNEANHYQPPTSLDLVE